MQSVVRTRTKTKTEGKSERFWNSANSLPGGRGSKLHPCLTSPGRKDRRRNKSLRKWKCGRKEGTYVRDRETFVLVEAKKMCAVVWSSFRTRSIKEGKGDFETKTLSACFSFYGVLPEDSEIRCRPIEQLTQTRILLARSEHVFDCIRHIYNPWCQTTRRPLIYV